MNRFSAGALFLRSTSRAWAGHDQELRLDQNGIWARSYQAILVQTNLQFPSLLLPEDSCYGRR
jgi:hypothetical protein